MLHSRFATLLVCAALVLYGLGYTNVEVANDLNLEDNGPEDLHEESVESVSIKHDAHLVRSVIRSEGRLDATKQKMSPGEDENSALQMLQARSEAFENEAVEQLERSLDGKWVSMTGLPTQQSSTEFNGVSSRATDGNLNTKWSSQSCTHTKREDNAWWKVDLTVPYRISTVKVVNRADTVGWEIDPFNVEVDSTPCKEGLSLADGQTSDIKCPMVGDEVMIHAPLRTAAQKNKWEQRRILMLCEVKIKGTKQSLLEMGSVQCKKHSVAAQLVVTPNATDGWCVPDMSSSVYPLPNMSKSIDFKELKVGRAFSFGGELETSRSECEEHLLESEELVRGAVWKAHSLGAVGKNSMGTCHLLSGRRIVGAKHEPGAFCMRKLTCPKNMDYWRSRAGVGAPTGMLVVEA